MDGGPVNVGTHEESVSYWVASSRLYRTHPFVEATRPAGDEASRRTRTLSRLHVRVYAVYGTHAARALGACDARRIDGGDVRASFRYNCNKNKKKKRTSNRRNR